MQHQHKKRKINVRLTKNKHIIAPSPLCQHRNNKSSTLGHPTFIFVDVDVSLIFHFIGAATAATSLEMMKG